MKNQEWKITLTYILGIEQQRYLLRLSTVTRSYRYHVVGFALYKTAHCHTILHVTILDYAEDSLQLFYAKRQVKCFGISVS